jgi:hypothetical protein
LGRRYRHGTWMIVALLLAPMMVLADNDQDNSDREGDNDRGRVHGAAIQVDPAHAGNGAYSGWGRDSGEPARNDATQYGLDLRHLLTTTPDGPYAGTRNLLSRPIPAEALERLAFDFSGRSGEAGVFVAGNPKHAYCSGGAPRFVVESDSGTCHLGCGHGDKTQDPQTNWWTASFRPPFNRYPGCAIAPGGMVNYIDITFDEGPAQVVLDNISATIAGRKTTVEGPNVGRSED